MKQPNRYLKDALVKCNVLTEEEIQKYTLEAQNESEPLKDYLLKKEIITDKQLLIALSQNSGLETVDLRAVSIDPSLIEKVPIKIAWFYKFVPTEIKNDTLTIASSLPLDLKTQDEIRMHLGVPVSVVLARETEMAEAFRKYYGFASDTIDRIMSKGAAKPKVSSADTGQWIEDLEKQTEDPTVSNLVNQIILEAYKKRATDIHIEPYRDKVRFRYRIDGVLSDVNLPSDVKHFLPQILSRIKILANLSITEKRLPQDGSAVVKTKDQHLDLRVSTMPTPRGESMVIRILPTKVMLFSMEKLGFNEEGVQIFRELIQKPHGIIFMTGPTGSGKTTTLYACLNELNSAARKIITIEDPVEYEMEGITQVQVNTKVNFNFADGLRSLLRHDPDIIMVGEVRDLETAEIAIRTALTGHLVFSTLHTNDAASGVTRLIDMGVEPYLVASSVEAFVAQRLVRIICPKCKEEVHNPMRGVKEEIMRALDLPALGEVRIYKGRGCDYCNNTGYYGRCAIYEVMVMTDAIRAAILEKPRSDYIKRISMKQGMMTLRQNAWKAVLAGITTPSEILNVTVKDEETEERIEERVSATEQSLGDAHEMIAKSKEMKLIKSHMKKEWAPKNQFDARTYPRAFVPVKIRYRLLRRDPGNPNTLTSDGIEYPTVTDDISAGGLRFKSKGLLPIGSILELKIQLDDTQKSLGCLAKVCRVEKDDMGSLYTIVTCYLDISSASKVAINRFVEMKLKEEEKETLSEKPLNALDQR